MMQDFEDRRPPQPTPPATSIAFGLLVAIGVAGALLTLASAMLG